MDSVSGPDQIDLYPDQIDSYPAIELYRDSDSAPDLNRDPFSDQLSP